MMRDVTLMNLIMRNLTDLFRFLASRRRSLRSGAMPQDRMNREEFFAKVAPLDAEQTGNGASGRRTSHGGTSCCLVTSMRNALSGWRTTRRSRAPTLISCGRGPRGDAETSMRRAP